MEEQEFRNHTGSVVCCVFQEKSAVCGEKRTWKTKFGKPSGLLRFHSLCKHFT